jgi:hypothetical protein
MLLHDLLWNTNALRRWSAGGPGWLTQAELTNDARHGNSS